MTMAFFLFLNFAFDMIVHYIIFINIRSYDINNIITVIIIITIYVVFFFYHLCFQRIIITVIISVLVCAYSLCNWYIWKICTFSINQERQCDNSPIKQSRAMRSAMIVFFMKYLFLKTIKTSCYTHAPRGTKRLTSFAVFRTKEFYVLLFRI